MPAIALLEYSSIARGIVAGDAMIKAAPLDGIYAGTVQPGKYLVLVTGDTASVEVAVGVGSAPELIDSVFLPDVHPAVVPALAGSPQPPQGAAIAVVETETVAAVLEAADAGMKGAAVSLSTIRLADGLGGKGYLLFSGEVSDVEAAAAIGTARVPGTLVHQAVIASLHAEMAENLWSEARFLSRLAEA